MNLKSTHRKNPVEVTLIQLREALDAIDDYGDLQVRKIEDEYEIYNNLHRSWIKLELTDYINISTSGDYYPIKEDIVKSTYNKI